MTTSEAAAMWLTIKEFSTEIGVSMSTAYKWAACGQASGKFPRFCKLPNGSIRIRRDWFDAWVEGLGPDA